MKDKKNTVTNSDVRADNAGKIHIGDVILTNVKPEDKYLTPPIPRPDYFTGREKELKELGERLHSNKPLLLMSGLGGIGKSTLALHYYHHPDHGEKYNHLAWVSLGNGDIMTGLIQHLSRAVEIEQSATTDKDEVLKEILRLMDNKFKGAKKLLVIDNANKLEDLDYAYSLLSGMHWHILITTRCKPGRYEILALEQLPPSEARKLFLKHFTGTDNPKGFDDVPELDSLLLHLNYHTLLTELLAKLGRSQGMGINALYDLIKNADLSHPDLAHTTIETGLHADLTDNQRQDLLLHYLLSIFEPEKLEAEEQEILRYFSILPSEDIPQLYLDVMFKGGDPAAHIPLNKHLFKLQEAGWLTLLEEASPKGAKRWYRMHPLLQEVIAKKLTTSADNCQALFENLDSLLKLPVTQGIEFAPFALAVVNNLKDFNNELAILNFRLADLYRNAGDYALVMDLLDSAEEIFKTLEDSSNLAVTLERKGTFCMRIGQTEKAFRYFEENMSLRKELFGTNPKNEQIKNGLAIANSKLGDLYQSVGQTEKALGYFEESMRLREELFEANPKNEQIKNGLAISNSQLGELYRSLGQTEKALGYFGEDIRLTEELFEANPKNEQIKNDLAISNSNLGNLYQSLGQTEKALGYFEESMRLREELFAANPKNEQIKNGLAIANSKLGDLYQSMGQTEMALGYFKEYMRLTAELFDKNPKNEQIKNGLAIANSKLGDLYQSMGQTEKALGYFDEDMRLTEELFDENPQSESLFSGLIKSNVHLGSLHRELGNQDVCLVLFTKALKMSEEGLERFPSLPFYKQSVEWLKNKLPK